MLSLEKAGEIIEKELEGIEIPSQPALLYDPVRYAIKNGGKRIRPSLVLISCDMFASDYKKAISPAIGIELFHNFTLLHDDLMDDSPIRRNQPTVHVKWDANTAILSGDVMSILAGKYIANVNENVIVRITGLFNQTAIEVCEGQMLDMEYAQKQNVTLVEYINMIRLKTSVLIAASLAIGAITGGADKNQINALYEFGLNLGLAFQIQDDYLDSYGDHEKFGKKIGNDILTNKRTFLAIKALENAKGEDLKKLQNYLSGINFDPNEKIKNVLAIYNKYEIGQSALSEINEYHNAGVKLLNELNIPTSRKETLMQFSEQLLKREK